MNVLLGSKAHTVVAAGHGGAWWWGRAIRQEKLQGRGGGRQQGRHSKKKKKKKKKPGLRMQSVTAQRRDTDQSVWGGGREERREICRKEVKIFSLKESGIEWRN